MTLHHILLELALVLSIFPNIQSRPFLLRKMVVSFEIVAICIEHLPRSFDMGLLPICLNFGFIGKGDNSIAVLFSINEIALINGTIIVVIYSLPVLFALAPQTLIDISVGVDHFALAGLNIVLPLSFINIAVRVVVPAPALLAIFDDSFIAFPIFEDIRAFGERIILPKPEVDVSVRIDVDPMA
jgi:hypothetical protein